MLTILCASCMVVERGIVVPRELVQHAQIPGFENIRYSTDETQSLLEQEFQNSIIAGASNAAQVNVLAISGGGADGAFGAGLLNGWTAFDSRPEFQIVTGVSTGALISPFAFLGPAYDNELRTAYTTLHAEDIFKIRNVFSIIRGDSMATSGPLFETISRFIDEEMLAEIASEHRKGRRLFILTTDLDSQRPVAWDMGAIAQQDTEDSLALFRKIIIASASVPVVFPPQYIEVEANGELYTEMHVDGGVMGQVFLHLPSIDSSEGSFLDEMEVEVTAYVIRNSKVVGDYSPMQPLIIPIMSRTISALVLTQGVGDLYEIYEQTREAGAIYKLAYVPDDFEIGHEDLYTPEGMKLMFDFAFEQAANGYQWLDRPPTSF